MKRILGLFICLIWSSFLHAQLKPGRYYSTQPDFGRHVLHLNTDSTFWYVKGGCVYPKDTQYGIYSAETDKLTLMGRGKKEDWSLSYEGDIYFGVSRSQSSDIWQTFLHEDHFYKGAFKLNKYQISAERTNLNLGKLDSDSIYSMNMAISNVGLRDTKIFDFTEDSVFQMDNSLLFPLNIAYGSINTIDFKINTTGLKGKIEKEIAVKHAGGIYKFSFKFKVK